jgi:hypothetical protein
MERVARLAILAAAFALGTAVSHAQTTTTLAITPNIYTCFNFSPVYPICDGIPLRDQMGHAGHLWLYVGDGDWLVFQSSFAYLDGKLTTIASYKYSSYRYSRTKGVARGTATFKGITSNGIPYTGTLTYTANMFTRCGHGCYSEATFTGGSVRVALQK